jgi:hypothetical protein
VLARDPTAGSTRDLVPFRLVHISKQKIKFGFALQLCDFDYSCYPYCYQFELVLLKL